MRHFQFSFWLLTISCLVIYGCVLPFNNIAQAIISQKFICHGPCPKTCPTSNSTMFSADLMPPCVTQKAAVAKASFLMGIPYIMSAALSPFLGGLIDRIGGRAIFALISSVALIGVHLCIGLLNNGTGDLYGPLIFQGLAYAVFAAALWPSVPYVVKPVSTMA